MGLCFDGIIDYALELGRFTQMVMLDLKNAYRILLIHPCDRSVLGVSWEGQVYSTTVSHLACAQLPRYSQLLLTF